MGLEGTLCSDKPIHLPSVGVSLFYHIAQAPQHLKIIIVIIVRLVVVPVP